MKHLKLLALLTFIPIFFRPTLATAASLQMTANLPQNELPASSEIVIPIVLKSSDPYNAYTITLEFENLKYVETKYNTEWTAINGPSQTGNTYTFTAAVLGKDTYKVGDTTVATVVVKTPESGAFSIKGASTVALTDAKATQISGTLPTGNYSVMTDKLKSALFNIENGRSWFFKSLRVIIPLILVGLTLLIFRLRKIRRGRKPTYT